MIHHNKGTLSWNDMQKLNLITVHLFEFFVEENIKSVSLDIYSVTKLFVNCLVTTVQTQPIVWFSFVSSLMFSALRPRLGKHLVYQN